MRVLLVKASVLVASTADSAKSPAYIAGTLLIPAAAVIMLIVGLVQRSKSAPKPMAPSPVPAHPGPPAAPGYPTAPVYPGPPATANRPKRRGTGLIIAGVVLLVLWLAGNAARAGKSSSHDTDLVVGDCVSASDYRHARLNTLRPTPCGDREAVYELAAKPGPGGTCPDGKKLADSDYFVLTDGSNALCFAANVVVGQCLRVDTQSNPITPVDCADRSGSGTLVRVAARFDGTTDPSRCPTPLESFITDQPARVICLDEPS
ncbi:LppU/SCO3897 family protein [Nocardia sp. CDC160]|uniref:LppU/SCO3897 family protein n=1 Tax=Nocardia sp. CDC160 TaxID=3112166 RepID=UPI002DBDEFCA|nr:hypothetical protein [Nocardia sp. CDC160]MEC3916809.1 hypothetical protein [Nocardia sp. CDC160]